METLLSCESVDWFIFLHVALCLAEQTALYDMLLDCTLTMTADFVFRIVFVLVCYVCICNGDLQ